MVSGALAGGSLYKAAGENTAIGVITGAAASLAATFATFHTRKTVVKSTQIFDPMVGAAEDAILIVAAMCLIKKVMATPKKQQVTGLPIIARRGR